jgi:diguanylate cyclase (GGDEF)-like protein
LFLPKQQAYAFSSDGYKTSVLVLNSYHEGYRWTDDIVQGINSVFGPEWGEVDLDFEYMDAKRNHSPDYLKELGRLYSHKFRNSRYDLVICSDESAFHFLKKDHHQLFPDIPIVFCGLNHYEEAMLEGEDLITGVVETSDVGATLDIMLKVHPDCRQIYVVNDSMPTGQSVAKELEKVIPRFPGVEFIDLTGLTMEELTHTLSLAPEDSLVLFLVFFRDGSGTYYSYDESIGKVAGSSTVPVYGLWDFYLGHGIVGGMLTSGYDQGRQAALLAKRILEGASPSSIPVVNEITGSFAFDENHLRRFGISHQDLPPNSRIINETLSDRKKLLVLHSYNPGMVLVRNINAGMKKVVQDREDIEIFFDYMDLKRHPEPAYYERLVSLFRGKYENSAFDAVIACDEGAYQFILAYGDSLFPQVPVVFLGVGDFEPSQLEGHPNVTGIQDNIRINGTLDLVLDLQPEVDQVVVINDSTRVGKANRSALEKIMTDYADRVRFIFYEDMNMSEIIEKVGILESNSIILLLTFNRDRSNNIFSYEESIRLIRGNASVPIYGIWDFYLGNGIIGGKLNSGSSVGEQAAQMAIRLLDGEPVSAVPPVRNTPYRYMFDYRELDRFGIKTSDLPPGREIINQPVTIYSQYKRIVLVAVFVVAVLSALVLILADNIRRRKRVEAELHHYATIDDMTGVFNRRTGMVMLEKQLANAARRDSHLCVCFVDANNLKQVNDKFGHDKGDQIILALCDLLTGEIRSSDILCRLGGDEFLLILPDCNISNARELWGRIEKGIARYNIQIREPELKLSVSCGFAQFDPSAPVSMDELINMADQAMYQEKAKLKAKK